MASATPVVLPPRQITLASLWRRARPAVVTSWTERGPDPVDLVGGDADADTRPAHADPPVGPPLGHGLAHGQAELGVVDRDVGRAGAQVADLVAGAGDVLGQRGLQVEPGMIRAHGNPHHPSVPTGDRPRRRHGTLVAPHELDPTTPVIVGVGQVTNRPDTAGRPASTIAPSRSA